MQSVLRLRIEETTQRAEPVLATRVGRTSFALGHRPQLIVPKFAWQSAETRSRWTLVGCTVSPAFDFAGFEMAKPGWTPG